MRVSPGSSPYRTRRITATLPIIQTMLTMRVLQRKSILLDLRDRSTRSVPAKLYNRYPLGTKIEMAPRMKMMEKLAPTQPRTVRLEMKAAMMSIRV